MNIEELTNNAFARLNELQSDFFADETIINNNRTLPFLRMIWYIHIAGTIPFEIRFLPATFQIPTVESGTGINIEARSWDLKVNDIILRKVKNFGIIHTSILRNKEAE